MKKYIYLLLLVILFLGCDLIYDDSVSKVSMSELEVADDFDYQTTSSVNVEIGCYARDNSPVTGIHFSVLTARIEDGGIVLAQGATDNTGKFNYIVNAPTSQDSLTIIGFMTTETLPIINNEVAFQFGGAPEESRGFGNNHPKDGDFEYLDSYDSNGIPDSMTVGFITPLLLVNINASLPERRPVPTYHPDYLSEGSVLNVILEEDADVWITFVHEGAGFKNSLGFYTYNVEDGAPENVDSLTHTIIFPNASIGNDLLTAGDKVNLGHFEAGTVIGWFLVQNGWDKTQLVVKPNAIRFYSNPEYNPEASEYQQHTILLHDDLEDKLLLAFEDLVRPGGDNDFNDAVFYVTSTPLLAINMDDINPIDIVDDSDNDGISDVYDDYPNDPDSAFDNFYPAEDIFGTLGFEDYWPKQGDYDMNDLVVGYNFRNVHNPQNKLIDIIGTVRVKAIGAGYHNGFAIELPILIADLSEWVGDSETMDIETDNDKLILKLFDDAYDIMNPPGEGFVNTEDGGDYFTPVDLNFGISLLIPQSLDLLEFQPPYNPFLRSNNVTGKEVHLPGYPPTLKADTSLFGTEDDSSNPLTGRYYKTANNLPWAINIPINWSYPKERKEISWGYTNFQNWAESSGTVNEDWYEYRSDNINENYIYIP